MRKTITVPLVGSLIHTIVSSPISPSNKLEVFDAPSVVEEGSDFKFPARRFEDETRDNENSNRTKGRHFEVEVTDTRSHDIPPYLWGLMFEDINYSLDGGLYAELLQNRAFQMVDVQNQSQSLQGWKSINGAILRVVNNETDRHAQGLSEALPNSLRVQIPKDVPEVGGKTLVGVGNRGYWGIGVDTSRNYNASFFIKLSNASAIALEEKRNNATNNNTNAPVTSIQVALQSHTTQEILASSNVTLSNPLSSTNWTQLSTLLTPTVSPPDTLNNLTLLFDGQTWLDTEFYISFASLMPPTFKNRTNGFRNDLSETLLDLKPKFFRFPGGNNLEGQTPDQRWQWKNTIGPLENRPGRLGDWGYFNTDGIGLLEYLQWVEDMDMQIIMGVYDGLSLGKTDDASKSGISVPKDELGPYIQDAIDQINFVTGNASENEWAALRAKYGHPEPFDVFRIEIGNEDQFAGDSLRYRWNAFYTNLSTTFPSLSSKFFATGYPFQPPLDPNPPAWDSHIYQTSQWMLENVYIWDHFQRNGTEYLQLEYAVTAETEDCLYGTIECGRHEYPTIQASVAEAAYMTGFERNADILVSTAYAPLLQNIAGGNESFQWFPNLICFNSDSIIRSTSYYVQQMYSANRGSAYLKSTKAPANQTTYWSVVQDNSTSQVIIKVSNSSPEPTTLDFAFPSSLKIGWSTMNGTLTVLQAPNANTSNTLEEPSKVVPSTIDLPLIGNNGTVQYIAPEWSFSVLNLPATL